MSATKSTPRPPYCIHCAGPAYGERDEGGRECSATDGDLCIWSDTRTPYGPSKKRTKKHTKKRPGGDKGGGTGVRT